MKLNATGKVVTEHVEIDEEDGEIVYSRDGGEIQRVLVCHKNPLRLEMYQRNKHSQDNRDTHAK
jgi:hypothetical protein